MFITYADIKHKLQPPLDCSKEGDLRGRSFHNCLIVNFKNTDFTGCVLYHCFPRGFAGAIEIRPAQSEEDVTLRGADLTRADLNQVNLQGADLQGADLRSANLRFANLGFANFYKANFYKANLQGADLQGADLQGANLEGADLGFANLEGANLYKTNLQGANLYGADLQGANLEGAEHNSKTTFDGSSITQEQLDSMTFVEDEDD